MASKQSKFKKVFKHEDKNMFYGYSITESGSATTETENERVLHTDLLNQALYLQVWLGIEQINQ